MYPKARDLVGGFGCISLLLTAFIVFTSGLYISQVWPSLPTGASRLTNDMSVTHILLVSFKPSASQETINEVQALLPELQR
jgi:hypothetical protein